MAAEVEDVITELQVQVELVAEEMVHYLMEMDLITQLLELQILAVVEVLLTKLLEMVDRKSVV